MNTARSANDFPTVLDAMLFHNAEIDRVAGLPAPEKLRQLDYLEAFALSIAERIERERGGESA